VSRPLPLPLLLHLPLPFYLLLSVNDHCGVLQASAHGMGTFPQQHNTVRAVSYVVASFVRRRALEEYGDAADR